MRILLFESFAAGASEVLEAKSVRVPVKRSAGDYNGDGEVTVVDAILILRAAMGLV